MRKIMNIFVLVAAAAMALVSCNKQEVDAPTPQEKEYEYTFEVADGVKAAIGDDCVVWESGDQIGVYTDGQNGVSYNRWGDITLGTPVTFKVSSYYALVAGDMVHCYYPYVSSNSQDPRTVNLSIPTSQTEKNQMPMVSLPYAVTENLAEKTDSEKSAGEIRFANLGSVIEFHVYSTTEAYQTELVKSVTFNADQAIAGDFTFDITAVDYSNEETLEISGYEATSVVSALATPTRVSADKNAATVVKMVVAPGSYTGNVVVTTNMATYTFPISNEKAKECKRSIVKPLGVDLTKAQDRTEVVNSNLFAIVALRNSEGYYYYMTNEDDGASTKRLVATVVGTEKPADGVSLPASKLWELVQVDETYTIKSYGSSQYVSWTSDNSAFMADEGLGFTVEEKDGKYTFKYVKSEDEVRYLSLNSSRGSDFYAMYKGTQTQELFLIPAVEGEEAQPTVESIEIANYTTSFTQGEEFVFGGIVTAKLSNGVTKDVTSSATFSGCDMNTIGEYTVTVTYEGKTATYKITVNEKPAEVKYYEKVTTAPSDWSGTYLIVYEGTPAYWDGSLTPGTSSGQMGSTAGMVKTTITDGKIQSTSTVDKSVITIAKSGTGYSLKAASGSYMGMSTNNNGLKSSTKATDYVHTINLESNGGVSILSSDGYTKVAYNKSSSFFRYYKVTTVSGNLTGYPLPCLYKLASDSEGGEIPDQPTLSPRNLVFSDDTATATMGQTFIVPTLNGVTTGVTYSSSNEAVATVNASTGDVTLVGEGTTTITATALATEEYEAGTAAYTLKVNAAQEDGDSTDPVVLSVKMSDLVSANNYTVSSGNTVKNYKNLTLDSVISMTAGGTGTNEGSFWNSGTEWRLYQSGNGKVTISAASGYIIKSVKLTYTVSNNGVLKKGTANLTSATVDNVNASSVIYTVGNTGSKTNGQIKISQVDIVYEAN